MSDPRPDEFRRFAELLTKDAPDSYDPWFFRCESGSKGPALKFGSWKDEEARLTVAEAVRWMKQGGNVGIAGRPNDRLINVDIDDEDETTPDDLKQTLIARSRSRTGSHAWYFESDHGEEIPNIPTDDKGEVRTTWQYVVAPGSYVPIDDESNLPPGEQADAGYYTVERETAVASLRYEELPEVFQQANKSTDEIEIMDGGVASTSKGGGNIDDDYDLSATVSERDGSALFDIDATDVVRKEVGSTNPGDRWSGIFHGSATGENMSVSGEGLLHCWRHSVAHNGLQAIATLSDYSASCEEIGSPHKRSNAGASCLQNEEGAHIWHAWKYAKRNGYIPDDDPVPYSALKHLCRTRGLCPVTDLPDNPDESIPSYAYDGAIESIRGHDELNPGRELTDEIDDDDTPSFDAETDGVEPVSAGETPGGQTDESGTDGDESELGYEAYVSEVIQAHSTDEITLKTARHRIAEAVADKYDFVYPRSRVRGWREVLYVYNDDIGIYEPHGEAFLESELEQVAGDFVDNQLVTEIISKIKRRSRADRREFTRRPERLVVGNGILDLHTGERDAYTPDEYHQQRIRVDWNPEASEPEHIDSFLHDVVAPDDVATMYRLIAHTLYREYIESKAAILLGSGQNGKSVFLELIENLLEPKYDTISRRELQDLDEYRFAANQLRGKLANLATEIGEQELTDTTTFKKLTGRDTMTADVKYETEVSFENHATLMFASNEMPVFSQDNHAIWRRWLLIEFPHEFNADDPDAKDPVERDVLLRNMTSDAELEGLLQRCQTEIERWHSTDEAFFSDAASADEIREKMKKAAEPVFHFVTACLEPADESEHIKKDRVRACYRAFAEEEDLPRIKQSEFGERLLNQRDLSISRGQVTESNGNRPRVYEAIKFSSRGRQLLGLDTADNNDQATVEEQYEQLEPQLLEIIRTQVAANDDEAVPRERIVWSAVSHDISKTEASRVLDSVVAEGKVVERDGEILPVDMY